MKLTVTWPKEDDMFDGRITIVSEREDKKISLRFGAGEPEDMNLARDLSDALSIPDVIKMAYEAGKNGEEFEIIYLDEEE